MNFHLPLFAAPGKFRMRGRTKTPSQNKDGLNLSVYANKIFGILVPEEQTFIDIFI